MHETSAASVTSSINKHRYPTAAPGLELPMLPIALNIELMTSYLKTLLLSLNWTSDYSTITRAELLDYKPGNRGLIRYEIGGTAGSETRVVFGKLYADPVQAARVGRAMQSLRGEVFSGLAQLDVPQPLGCILDLSMLVYLPAEGQFLDEMASNEQALHFITLAGKWLATLHQHRLVLDRQFQLANELLNLRAWAALIGQKYHDQVKTATQLVSYLDEYAHNLPFTTHVPIHKDFHYGHLIVNGRLNVIDFDEMRLGDPNFDLAHFCANLYLLACRKRNPSLPFSALQTAFLSAYAEDTGWTPDERFVYFFVYTCLKIARQLCTSYGPYPRPQGGEERRQVRLILEQGLATTSPNGTKDLSGKIPIPGSLERPA